LHETVAKALYEGYVPGYAAGYLPLGDQEAFTLKYVWELTVYFVAYCFPFMNELFTDPTFVGPFLQRFTKLGPWNRGLQELLTGFLEWKQERGTAGAGGADGMPLLYEFSDLPALARSRVLMNHVGLSAEEALSMLEPHWADLEELSRYMAAHVMARVLGEPRALHNRAFVESIDMNALRFDPADMEARWQAARSDRRQQRWSFDTQPLAPFWPAVAGDQQSEKAG
jgi:hypothetical protein